MSIERYDATTRAAAKYAAAWWNNTVRDGDDTRENLRYILRETAILIGRGVTDLELDLDVARAPDLAKNRRKALAKATAWLVESTARCLSECYGIPSVYGFGHTPRWLREFTRGMDMITQFPADPARLDPLKPMHVFSGEHK